LYIHKNEQEKKRLSEHYLRTHIHTYVHTQVKVTVVSLECVLGKKHTAAEKHFLKSKQNV